jgi:tetratricopeptide (TPR) repeat protein
MSPQAEEIPLEAEQANREAYSAFQERNFAVALSRAQSARELAKAAGNQIQTAFAATNEAAALAMFGRWDDALPLYEGAASTFEKEGRALHRGRIAVALGIASYMLNDKDRGEREFELAAKLLGEDDWNLGFVKVSILLWANLDMWPAYTAFEKLRDRAREADDPKRLAAASVNLGWVIAGSGNDDAAVKVYEEAIALFKKMGDVYSIAIVRRNIGIAYLRVGKLEEAEHALMEALSAARRIENTRLEFAVLNDLGIAHAQAGRQKAAREADLEAEVALARVADGLRSQRLRDTPLIDYYHLLRMRYLTLPTLLIEPFNCVLDQLAVDPDSRKKGPLP